MPSLKIYDAFISHAWKYHDDYDRLVKLLDNAPNFKWRNYSVPVDKAFEKMPKKELKEELKDQIRPVNIVVILAGMYAAHSDWIDFEIAFAEELEKPMIGVRPWGQQRTPGRVQNAVQEMGGWNTHSIVKAIRNWAL